MRAKQMQKISSRLAGGAGTICLVAAMFDGRDRTITVAASAKEAQAWRVAHAQAQIINQPRTVFIGSTSDDAVALMYAYPKDPSG